MYRIQHISTAHGCSNTGVSPSLAAPGMGDAGGASTSSAKCTSVPALVAKCAGSRQSCRQLPAQGWQEITIGRAEHQPGLAIPAGRECQPPGFRGSLPLRREHFGFGPLAGLVTALGETCQTCAGRRKSRVADLFWGWGAHQTKAMPRVVALLQFGLSRGTVGSVTAK